MPFIRRPPVPRQCVADVGTRQVLLRQRGLYCNKMQRQKRAVNCVWVGSLVLDLAVKEAGVIART